MKRILFIDLAQWHSGIPSAILKPTIFSGCAVFVFKEKTMKHTLTIALATASLLLAGCASGPQQPVASCVFADGSNQPAPEWVCGAPVEGIDLSAVGYADKSA